MKLWLYLRREFVHKCLFLMWKSLIPSCMDFFPECFYACVCVFVIICCRMTQINVCMFTCFQETLLLCYLLTYNTFQVVNYCWNVVIPAKSGIKKKERKEKLLMVVSCSGKLHSVSLQLRGQAANSRAPSWRWACPDYASTPRRSFSKTHTDEVSLRSFHLSQHSIQ